MIGTAYAAGASDRRHKKNIQDADFNELEVIESLHPMSFEWIKPFAAGMEGEQMGFIAQELESILPQVVLAQDNEKKTKGFKFNALIPLLAKAIQEQQQVI